jgi:hypothetical protein
MNKQLFTVIALAGVMYTMGRLVRNHVAATRESSVPPSFPIVRAMWPVTEDIRQLASRCRWRDLIQSWDGADAHEYLRQPMSGERADDVANGLVLGQVGERATG